MLTSLGLRGQACRMQAIGFSAYLTKQVRRPQLYNCLMSVFSQQPAMAHPQGAVLPPVCLPPDIPSRIRILVVEDNNINLKLILRIIEKFGFQADSATNAKEALSMLEALDFDLVLMDLQMPEMDGLEATRRVREPGSRVRRRDVPIIALTANAMKGDRNICLAAGMNDYAAKPINPQQLLDVIHRNCLKNRN